MFVWHWVQQHRLLSVMVLALVIVSSRRRDGVGARLPHRVVAGGPARGAAHVPARADRQDAGHAAQPAAGARASTRTAPAAARASTWWAWHARSRRPPP